MEVLQVPGARWPLASCFAALAFAALKRLMGLVVVRAISAMSRPSSIGLRRGAVLRGALLLASCGGRERSPGYGMPNSVPRNVDRFDPGRRGRRVGADERGDEAR